jgi:ZIP family zinc transporter
VLGASNAVAAGVMLAASLSLSLEGVDRSLWHTAVGVALGICFVLVSERYLQQDHRHTLGSLSGEDARRALLIVGVMTVHSAGEGIGVGAAFADGSTLGLLITIAIAVHNIPKGLRSALSSFHVAPRSAPRQDGASSRACRSHSSPFPRSCSSTHSRRSSRSRWDSRQAQWCGWYSGATPEALETAPARVVALAGGTAFALMLGFQLLLS